MKRKEKKNNKRQRIVLHSFKEFLRGVHNTTLQVSWTLDGDYLNMFIFVGIPAAAFFHLSDSEKEAKLEALKFPQTYCMTLSGLPLPKVKHCNLATKQHIREHF